MITQPLRVNVRAYYYLIGFMYLSELNWIYNGTSQAHTRGIIQLNASQLS